MKVHVLHLLAYIFATVVIVTGIVIFDQPVLMLLLIPFFILPAIDIPLFLLTVSNVECRIFSKAEYIMIGNEIPIVLTCSNSSFYPFLQCNLEYYVNNLFYNDRKLNVLSFAVMPKEASESTIILESPECGMVSLQAEDFMLTDLLGFFTVTKPFHCRVDVPVLPKEEAADPIPLNTPADGLDEYEESDQKGNLSSDVKEIREYRPGDRIQRIHWKLSAKLDELFVKEMAHTSTLSLVLLPELGKNEFKETLSTLMGISKLLLQDEERFEICLYHHQACEFRFLTIPDSEALIHAFYELYYLPVYETGNNAKDCYFASSQKNASVIHIKGSHVEIIPGAQ